jgi:ribonucleoside-diphosphate reductase alpha chain
LSPDDKAMLGLIDRSALVSEPPASGPSGGPGTLASAPPASLARDTLGGPGLPTAPEGDPRSKDDEPKATAVAVDDTKSSQGAFPPDGARVTSSTPAPASDDAGSELTVVATNGHANGHATNGIGKSAEGAAKPITLSLGTTNVAFKIQEDAPSCAECGSIMVRNGSCYKCLNCGSTSGCS